MARLVLLVLGLLLGCTVWLWLHVDPAPIAPAMAADDSLRAVSASHPVAENGTLVPSAEPAAGTPNATPTAPVASERTEVASVAKRYTIRGTVTRSGVGQPGRDVLCSSGWGKTPVATVTGQGGVFAFEVEPGEYELYAPHMLGSTRQQPAYKSFPPSGRDRLAAAQCTCEVKDADVEVAMPVSQHSLTVLIRNAKTLEPISWAAATWRPPIPEQDELEISADYGGRVRFSDVTLGASSIVVSARAFVGAEKSVEVAADQSDQVIEFLLEPASAVDVVMVDEQGQAIAVSKAQNVSLEPDADGRAIYPSNRKQFLSKERPMVTPFDGLTRELYHLHFDGDWYGLSGDQPTVRFAPCVPKGKHMIAPKLGELQRMEVPVVQRSYATLRVVDQQGELINTELKVTLQGSDGVVRRVLPAPWQHGNRHGGSHFEGYLKPGVYSLSCSQGGRNWREPLQVRELVVDQTVRVPW